MLIKSLRIKRRNFKYEWLPIICQSFDHKTENSPMIIRRGWKVKEGKKEIPDFTKPDNPTEPISASVSVLGSPPKKFG